MSPINPMSVFRFVLALALMPVVLGIARRLRMPEARPAFLVGFLAIVVAFGMAAVSPFLPADIVPFVRALRHVTFGIGGFGLAWAAWEARVSVLASTGGRR